MFSPTTTQAVAAKRGILRNIVVHPQVVPKTLPLEGQTSGATEKKRVRFADNHIVPASPSPSPTPTRSPRRRAVVTSPVDTILVDAPALSLEETLTMRAARVRERNQFWDETIQRAKTRRLEEAEKKNAAAAAAMSATEPAQPAEPAEPTTTLTPTPAAVPMTFTGRVVSATYAFFASILLAIQTWWYAKIRDPFLRLLDDKVFNECLDDVAVFFGERAILLLLIAFCAPLAVVVYFHRVVKWCVDSATEVWLGGFDGLRSRISRGSHSYHRRRGQLPPWMRTSAVISLEEDYRCENIMGTSTGTTIGVYHRHEQHIGMSGGTSPKDYYQYRWEQRMSYHIGMNARAAREEYYNARVQRRR